jgi:hypothetical protein
MKRVKLLRPSKSKRSRPSWDEDDDDDRPLTKHEQAEWEQTERNLDAVVMLMAALGRVDKTRASMVEASNQLYELVRSDDIPEPVRTGFKHFWKAGGATREHYQAWLSGTLGREPVSHRKHLRLVAENRTPVRRDLISSDHPPEAA